MPWEWEPAKMVKSWLDGLVTAKATDWTFAALDASQVPAGLDQIPAQVVNAESGYLTLSMRSMRIVDVRKLTTKFYAVVHAFTALDHLSGTKAQFHVVTTPGDLKELDPGNIDNVITFNRPMLGPIPYRGGALDVNLALLSVKSGDLAAPYIELLQTVSKQAGFSFVNTMLPFAEPLSQGIALLIGAQPGSILQVGVSTTFNPARTGYYVIMRAPKATTDLTKLHLDTDYRLVDASGHPFKSYPYVVFSVSAEPKRSDWFMVPEISKAHQTLQAEVRTGQPEKVDEAFKSFKLITLTSPDLLRADARTIVDKVDAELKELGPKLTAGERQEIRALKDIGV